ncbi:hypothetical protein [Halomarina ordinaria]|uniref:C2H2-type domain-containing protein n=1 Tax=Halomarina ordinaria TaxID=3033939 RepID=A0ABD5U9A7_9EURY|nr:hypothetical protein [Halomarina sp. PSRA2]
MSSDESVEERLGVLCPTCGKSFVTESGMKSHHLQVHEERL